MKVHNAVAPTPEGMQAFLAKDIEGPVSMLNLLKFKEKAEYADGRETELTGAEAYGLYGRDMSRWVTSHGGRAWRAWPDSSQLGAAW